MNMEYLLTVQMHHNHEKIDACANNIAVVVNNHDNWVKPIVPEEGDCLELEFIPEKFDQLRNLWQCLQVHEGELRKWLSLTIAITAQTARGIAINDLSGNGDHCLTGWREKTGFGV